MDDPSGPADADDDSLSSRNIVELGLVVAGALLIAIILRAVAVQAFFIPSESMEPTLHIDDRVLVNKVSYKLHDPNRGDVVVFQHPTMEGRSETRDLIKRVIALPGEQLFFEGATVHVNGQPLPEPYLPEGTQTTPAPREAAYGHRQCLRAEPCTVPPRTVWLMGDNRLKSQDSRYIGPISYDDIVGRAFVIIWPPGRVGGL